DLEKRKVLVADRVIKRETALPTDLLHALPKRFVNGRAAESFEDRGPNRGRRAFPVARRVPSQWYDRQQLRMRLVTIGLQRCSELRCEPHGYPRGPDRLARGNDGACQILHQSNDIRPSIDLIDAADGLDSAGTAVHRGDAQPVALSEPAPLIRER